MRPRPWRLTRRQRVEMDAALTALRAGPHPYHCDCIGPSDGTVAALAALGLSSGDVPTDHDEDDGVPERVLRARLAIALRAALRADEDARCEEALGRVRHVYDGADYERSEMRGAAEDWCDELREWPPITYRRAGPEIPLVTVHPELADHPWAHGLTSRAYYVRLALWEKRNE